MDTTGVEVTPIAITEANWPIFVDKIIKYTNKSPARALDAAGVTPGELSSYLAALANDEHPRDTLRYSDNILRFGSVSFLVKSPADVAISIATSSSLSILVYDSEYDIYIISGTLYDWKYSLPYLCSDRVKFKVRYAANCCMLHMERTGLFEIFNSYSKKTLPDGTFTMRSK